VAPNRRRNHVTRALVAQVIGDTELSTAMRFPFVSAGLTLHTEYPTHEQPWIPANESRRFCVSEREIPRQHGPSLPYRWWDRRKSPHLAHLSLSDDAEAVMA